MPGRELLQNGGPTAGFYGEDPVGEYGQYGTESGADAGTEAVTERGLSQFGPKDTTDLKPLFEKYDFSAVVGADITYYDKMGAIGQCTQTWVPPGFSTVALAAPTFNSGLEAGTWCGTCVRACFNDLGLGQGERCFDAIIDNVCPECDAGDLDLAESGDGRWPVEWTPIKCPERDEVLGTTQGSNPYYAKMKFEGGPSSVFDVGCFDIDFNFWSADPTPDGFWEIDPVGGAPEGAFRCGAQCSVAYTCCAPGFDVVTLFPGQFDSDGDGCPDSLDFF